MDSTDQLYFAVAAFNDAACILAAGNSPLRERLKVALGEIATVDLPAGSDLGVRIETLRETLTDLESMSEDDLGSAATEFVGIAVDAAGLVVTAEAQAEAARA